MTPLWFLDAHAKLGVDDLWAVVMFEAFNQFPHNQTQPWNPDNAGFGNFHPQFDKQPGIEEARKRCWELLPYTDAERREILEAMEKRGIRYLHAA